MTNSPRKPPDEPGTVKRCQERALLTPKWNFAAMASDWHRLPTGAKEARRDS